MRGGGDWRDEVTAAPAADEATASPPKNRAACANRWDTQANTTEQAALDAAGREAARLEVARLEEAARLAVAEAALAAEDLVLQAMDEAAREQEELEREREQYGGQQAMTEEMEQQAEARQRERKEKHDHEQAAMPRSLPMFQRHRTEEYGRVGAEGGEREQKLEEKAVQGADADFNSELEEHVAKCVEVTNLPLTYD